MRAKEYRPSGKNLRAFLYALGAKRQGRVRFLYNYPGRPTQTIVGKWHGTTKHGDYLRLAPEQMGKRGVYLYETEHVSHFKPVISVRAMGGSIP